jgi:hypothetical protein
MILSKESFGLKQNPKIKTLKNLLLMQERPRLLTDDDV